MWDDAADPAVATVDAPPRTVPATGSSAGDLEMVEQLVERCWRELDTSSQSVKVADLVRLLELKNKLRPGVDSERAFWSMIDEMRKEELGDFGEARRETLDNARTNEDTEP